ncbi:oxidoreductase [Streptomyces violaceusniger]|uniref:Aldo/keto reductase n=2 Tax=Streptomyces violaceusniger group TaxID=2839105 RepID=A0ABD5JLQ6_9ACTN|nr:MULTISPECIES: aldo/keto reductase [Streptomyces]KUL67195.1 oxidoreductase [Streptomyces violaceusniger]MEE4588829.1 aldo/keto reductase [Streptomyces sp. DSM 41602]RSS34593.1 aldo/keto reductase [Streptomyces sp. WAC05858]
MSKVPFITLNNGVRMPQLGFGVWQIPDDEAQVAVRTALDAGYRSIDTAAIYGNEEGTGKGLAASGIARDELFVTTKLQNADQGYDSTLRAFDASLTRLGLEYVDLYLIHWPLPGVDKYVDTWKAFEKIYSEGRAKAIGLSNFHAAHTQRLLSETSIVPVIDQIELHPQLQQAELRAFNARHDIATEAWSPLGQGKGLLDDPKLAAIARKHGKSPAQVVLRWHLDLGNVVIPKSVTPSRIQENIDVFDFQLDSEDLSAIDSLETGNRLGFDPETFNG